MLKGIIYYVYPDARGLVKLTGSTSNANRLGGGTAYYCVPRSDINFLCSDIDAQIPAELMDVQVAPEQISRIRATYTQDIAERLGRLRPDERVQLESALKAVDEEEARMAQLAAAGKITESVWDSLWHEWQHRRSKIRSTLEAPKHQHQTHITNLDMALAIIAQVGVVYNTLERSDQKELLRQMVERVVVNPAGKAKLELRAPFAYLRDISDQVRVRSAVSGAEGEGKTKTGKVSPAGLSEPQCSDWVLSCGKDRNLSEPPSFIRTRFLQLIAFPQRTHLVRFSTSL